MVDRNTCIAQIAYALGKLICNKNFSVFEKLNVSAIIEYDVPSWAEEYESICDSNYLHIERFVEKKINKKINELYKEDRRIIESALNLLEIEKTTVSCDENGFHEILSSIVPCNNYTVKLIYDGTVKSFISAAKEAVSRVQNIGNELYNQIEQKLEALIVKLEGQKLFQIEYLETYNGLYAIWADTQEEAIEKLVEEIGEGAQNAPDNCCDSEYNIVRVEFGVS